MSTAHRRSPVLDFYKEWKTQRRRDREQKRKHGDSSEDRKENQKEARRTARRKTKSAGARPSRLRTAYAAITARVHPFTALVVGASMLAAWAGQYQAATALGMASLAFLVPLITEGATLAFARSAEEAVHEDRPAGMWRLFTAAAAVVAAALNYYGHITLPLSRSEGLTGEALRRAQDTYQSQHEPKALIFAFASLAGLIVWEGSLIAKRRKKKGKTTRQALIARRRRIGNPLITWHARGLARRNPALTDDQAFTAAWTLRKGIGPADKTPREIRRERRMAHLRSEAEAWDGRRRVQWKWAGVDTAPQPSPSPPQDSGEDSAVMRELDSWLEEVLNEEGNSSGTILLKDPPGGEQGGPEKAGEENARANQENGQTAGQSSTPTNSKPSTRNPFRRRDKSPKRLTARDVRLTAAEKKLPYPEKVAATVQRLTDAGVNVSAESVRVVAGGRWETAKEALETLQNRSA